MNQTAPLPVNQYRIEVIADSSGNWFGNSMVYDTFDEAKAAARDLAGRWMLVTKARVVAFNDTGDVSDTVVF